MPGGERAAVIGVDLGGTKCDAVLADENGAILHRRRRLTRELSDPADLLLGVIADLRRAAHGSGHAVAAVGIGIRGFVEPASGLVMGAFALDWHGYDLAARLGAAGTEPYSSTTT